MTSHAVHPDWHDAVRFGDTGPEPQRLVDRDGLRSVLVGLRAGQRIPVHPAPVSTYHVLEGTGTMTVEGEDVALAPGVTVVVDDGAGRGVVADSDLVFLGSQPNTPQD